MAKLAKMIPKIWGVDKYGKKELASALRLCQQSGLTPRPSGTKAGRSFIDRGIPDNDNTLLKKPGRKYAVVLRNLFMAKPKN